MTFSVKKIGDLTEVKELAGLQSEVKEVKLEEKLGEQGFLHYTKKTLQTI